MQDLVFDGYILLVFKKMCWFRWSNWQKGAHPACVAIVDFIFKIKQSRQFKLRTNAPIFKRRMIIYIAVTSILKQIHICFFAGYHEVGNRYWIPSNYHKLSEWVQNWERCSKTHNSLLGKPWYRKEASQPAKHSNGDMGLI